MVGRWTIYALQCSDGCYYIGMTTDPTRRLTQHHKGKGSWFTRAHKPLEIVEQFEVGYMTDSEAAAYESKLAACYIDRYGIDHVRGGAFITKIIKRPTKLTKHYLDLSL